MGRSPENTSHRCFWLAGWMWCFHGRGNIEVNLRFMGTVPW